MRVGAGLQVTKILFGEHNEASRLAAGGDACEPVFAPENRVWPASEGQNLNTGELFQAHGVETTWTVDARSCWQEPSRFCRFP